MLLAATAVAAVMAAPGVAAASAPFAYATDAKVVDATTATLSGQLNPGGEATTYTFQYAASSNDFCNDPTTGTHSSASGPSTVTGSGYRAVALQVSGLTAGQEYCVRLVASNASGIDD